MTRKVLRYKCLAIAENAAGMPIAQREFEVGYRLDEDFNDIFEYTFEQMFHTKFNCMNWHLTEGAKALYKEMEGKWLKNELDAYYLYRDDRGFEEFLMGKYSKEAAKLAESQVISDIRGLPLSRFLEFIPYSIKGDYIEVYGEVYNGRL